MSTPISKILEAQELSISFEFFPPKTDVGEEALWQTLDTLSIFKPDFVSVTYGAGGSTRDRTIAITKKILSDTDLVPIGHLTCVDATKDELRQVIEEFNDAGVRNILALRGDPPDGPSAPWVPTRGGLDYASELVELTLDEGDFCVGVAAAPSGHPSATSHQSDIDSMVKKQEAGASFALSQFFFEANTFNDYVSRLRMAGCEIPVVPGVMPITNWNQIRRMSELSGSQIPSSILNQFEGLDDQAIKAKGIELSVLLCTELIESGVTGLHFYPLNKVEPAKEILERLIDSGVIVR